MVGWCRYLSIYIDGALWGATACPQAWPMACSLRNGYSCTVGQSSNGGYMGLWLTIIGRMPVELRTAPYRLETLTAPAVRSGPCVWFSHPCPPYLPVTLGSIRFSGHACPRLSCLGPTRFGMSLMIRRRGEPPLSRPGLKQTSEIHRAPGPQDQSHVTAPSPSARLMSAWPRCQQRGKAGSRLPANPTTHSNHKRKPRPTAAASHRVSFATNPPCSSSINIIRLPPSSSRPSPSLDHETKAPGPDKASRNAAALTTSSASTLASTAPRRARFVAITSPPPHHQSISPVSTALTSPILSCGRRCLRAHGWPGCLPCDASIPRLASTKSRRPAAARPSLASSSFAFLSPHYQCKLERPPYSRCYRYHQDGRFPAQGHPCVKRWRHHDGRYVAPARVLMLPRSRRTPPPPLAPAAAQTDTPQTATSPKSRC
jgi:hypothetical protein